MKRTVLALIAVLCIAATPAAKKPTAAYGVWTVHAAQIDYNKDTGAYSTTSKVTIVRPGGDVSADSASGNQKKGTLTLTGNVIAHDISGAYDSSSGAKNHAPSTLTCDTLSVDNHAKTYVATGHVHYVQGDTTSDADKGTLNDATHTLVLVGNVHIVDGPRKLTADTVKYNTATGDIQAIGKPDAILTIPGGPGPTLATPRPIHIPFGKKPTPKATRQ